MRSTLRAKLTIWYVGILAAVLIIASFSVYSLLKNNYNKALDSSLQSAVEVVALALDHETTEHNGKGPGEQSLREVMLTMHQTSFPRPNISVWEGDRLVAEKPGSAGLIASHIRTQLRPGELLWSNPTHRFTAKLKYVTASNTTYRIVANESLQPTTEAMRQIRDALLFVVPVCLLLAAAGGYFLARKSLAPVRDMARAAEHISSANLDQRFPVDNPNDELGELADTFNRLFERLQNAFRQQRRFMADASHELRTPISVALTATQVSLDSNNQTAESVTETLEVVQAQMLRLRRVVEDMFLLAQADSGSLEPNRNKLYLDEVVLESIRAARVLGQARGVTVNTGEIVPDAEYTADEGLLRQLFLILLDNAIKYTPASGNVDVSLTRAGNAYRLRIADTGPGIPPADQPHIFDRFYRVDKARSRRQPGAGSGAGLGLAIAQWITQLHHGRLWLDQSGPQGSVFCIELPMAA